MALILHRRPSEILGLTGDPAFLFEFDYAALNRIISELRNPADPDNPKAKLAEMENWLKCRNK